jgi:hypothetical protein
MWPDPLPQGQVPCQTTPAGASLVGQTTPAGASTARALKESSDDECMSLCELDMYSNVRRHSVSLAIKRTCHS